ncbi:hypothetical protein V2J09_013030 [Rumex salicifolius]
MVPVPFIILYLNKLATFLAGKGGTMSRLLDMLFKSAKQKAGPIEEFQWLSLMLFVAVPFPVTGAWTGAIIASMLNMPFWYALSANFFGVVLAGLLVNLHMNLGLKYAVVMGITLILVSTLLWSSVHSIRNRHALAIAMKRVSSQERECLNSKLNAYIFISMSLLEIFPSNFLQETTRNEDEGSISKTTANCSHNMSRPQVAKQDYYAPLVTALKSAAEDNAASFHFPGHNRGQAAPTPLTELIGKKPYVYDLPELPELDNLFSPEGPILDAQKRAAEVFGASETWFLTGGTTCGVQAAIMATCSPGDTLILPRNCHISAISGMVLSGATPKYIIPDYQFDWEIAGPVDQAIKDLESEGQKPAAIFVTSPTYHGMCSNLRKISELCNSKDIPLIVDEAHGAHFGFHPGLPSSALNQGADLAIQSTHKVLCSLTQSSMLHSSGRLVDRERISRCLQTLQSTSPNYLLLASLDAATAQLAINPESAFKNAIHLADEAKALIKQIPGLSVLESRSFSELPAVDPLRVTVGVWELGLSGYKADEFLFKDQGVMCELIGSRSITFVFTPGTREDHVKRLVLGFKNLSTSFSSHQGSDQSMKDMETEPLGCSKMQLSPREAFFARKRKVSLEESIGKISGELICPYPPGIPVLVPGEIITRKALDYVVDIKRQGGVITGASNPLLFSIVICDP